MRALALTYVTGMTPRPEFSAVCFNLVPGVGEYFVFPALTTSGPCEIMVFEGVPGGPMDCWGDVSTPAEHLARSKWILETFMPWEAERCHDGRAHRRQRDPLRPLPADDPQAGRPAAVGAGRARMADAVILNDPITGQGSNNAAKGAAVYLQSILERGEGPFDEAWMQETFERLWVYAEKVVGWTNALLLPPPPHVLEVLGAAGQFPAVAHRFANGFDNPPDFYEWFMDPDSAGAYLAEVAAA